MKARLRTAQLLVLVLASCACAAHSSKAAAEQEDPPTGSSTTSILEDQAFDANVSNLPTNISADSLTLKAKERIFTYKGNVTVEQGDMKLTSKTLEGTYGEDNQIQKLTAKGNVTITKQEIEATGQQALYDAASATVVLSDNPQLKQGESLLTADRIRVFLRENRSQAEGSVRVTLVKNKDAAAPSFLSLVKDEEAKTRESTAATVATPAPSSKANKGTTESDNKVRKTSTTSTSSSKSTPASNDKKGASKAPSASTKGKKTQKR
jgi:lipopolysaccharide export system protein LptA